MIKKYRFTTCAARRFAFCSAVLGSAFLLSLPAQAQVMTPDDSTHLSTSRGVSNNPYGYIQTDTGDGNGSDDAVGPDTADGGGFVAPSDDNGDNGDSDFGQMYGGGDDEDTPSSLNDFVQEQDTSNDARESKREQAIVKAALDKQRQIRDANIAQRQREQAMIKKAAKAAAGKGDDGTDGYSVDGGDDGYYGPIDDQGNNGGE